jgi:tripartite-type tricarboxylate transporter receptor subunit TctC
MRPHELGIKHGSLRPLRTALVVFLAATASALAFDCALSEPNFPAKPIAIFIPYGAGGVADLTMRLLAQKLTERTKQQVVIENRPGAGGLLAAKEVLRAPANGYTLGVIGNGTAIGMSLFKTRPYNVLTDFTFVSMTARFEMLLAVKVDSPLKTLQDVVAAARRDPGKLNFGAINPGSTQNLSAHLLQLVTGIDVAIVPYKTTPDLVTAVLRGDVDVGFDFYAGLQAVISNNQVRIIASSGEERNPLLRNVSTAKESGFPEFVVISWNGLASAAGMPAETLTMLNQHINAALADPALQATASTLGMDARGSTPEEMRDRMASDVKKWAAVIEKAGIEKQ